MTKLSPFEFKRQAQELIDFKDEVSTILNYGKYQTKVIIGGTPTWVGQEGEVVIAWINTGANYIFINSAWHISSLFV